MIETRELSKKYGEFTALQPLSLHIASGDIFCLLGANGAGKSTTINLCLGFIAPSSGSVKIHGYEVGQHQVEARRHLAYIPENLMLYPNLSGLENLAYFAGLASQKYPEKQLAEFLLEAGLQEEAHRRRVAQYSKGMRQKVGIALALARKTSVLLLDEPTSGLDPQASNEFSALLLKLKAQGVATLMATHDLFRARQVATHIGIMKQGVLVHSFDNNVELAELESVYLETIQGA